MGQNYHHLSALERNVLQHQLNIGSSQALIALTLGRSQTLEDSVEDAAVGIDWSPLPVFLSIDGDDHRVKMPLVGKVAVQLSPDFVGDLAAEFRHPF